MQASFVQRFGPALDLACDSCDSQQEPPSRCRLLPLHVDSTSSSSATQQSPNRSRPRTTFRSPTCPLSSSPRPPRRLRSAAPPHIAPATRLHAPRSSGQTRLFPTLPPNCGKLETVTVRPRGLEGAGHRALSRTAMDEKDPPPFGCMLRPPAYNPL